MVFIANAGIPMLFPSITVMFFMLIPIVLIEALVARREFNFPLRYSFKNILIANCLSTFIGFPILWIFLAILQAIGARTAYGLDNWYERLFAVTIQAPWLLPYGNNAYWMVPLSAIFLLIPAFFVSVWCECLVLKWFWRDQFFDAKYLYKFSFKAHCYSYLILILFWLFLLLGSIIQK